VSGVLNAYANERECIGCGNGPAEQLWIDAHPDSPYVGKCTGCALEARGIPIMTTSTALASPTDIEALAVERTAALTKLDALRRVKIQTPAHKAAFAAALAHVKEEWKKLDAREKALIRPAMQSIDATRETFRGAKAAYVEIEAYIKAELADYETRCGLEVLAATERANELAAAGDADGAREALMRAGEADAAQDGVAGATVSHPWKWEIVNLEMLERRFLLVNAKELTAEMYAQLKANPDVEPVVAGVKFFRTIQISATPKRGKR